MRNRLHQADPPVEVVHHPVESSEVDRLDNPHVIERDVQPVVDEATELAA